MSKSIFKPGKSVTTQFGRNEDLGEIMGYMLREARFNNGRITQAELARRLHTKQPAVARAEKGVVASIDWWVKAIRACGSDVQFHVSLETEE